MDILRDLLQVFAAEAVNTANEYPDGPREHIEEIRRIEDFPNGGLRFSVTCWHNESEPARSTREMSLIELLTLIGSVVAVYSVIPAVTALRQWEDKNAK